MGDDSNKYFFSVIKHRRLQQVITQLEDKYGVMNLTLFHTLPVDVTIAITLAAGWEWWSRRQGRKGYSLEGASLLSDRSASSHNFEEVITDGLMCIEERGS